MGKNSVLSNIVIKQEEEKITAHADYMPLRIDSENFVRLTHDRNPIHYKLPICNEAIAPGFMHTTAALALLSEIMRNDNDHFPRYWIQEVNMNGVVITGIPHKTETTFDPKNKIQISNILNPKNSVQCSIKNSGYDIWQDIPLPSATLIHQDHIEIPDESVLSDFGSILNPNLNGMQTPFYALACASSVVFSAIDAKKIRNPAQEVMNMYASQHIQTDMETLKSIKKSMTLDFYLSEPDKFGVISPSTIDMCVIGKNENGEVAYIVSAPLAFKEEARMMKLIRRYLKQITPTQ